MKAYIFVAFFAVHFLLTLSFVPPYLLFGGDPIARLDYALHFSRVVASDQFLSTFNSSWGYNPYFLAGYPAGTVFDVNNHFIEIFVFVMHRLGMSLPAAFNLLIFLAILLVPVLTWLTARNFRLTIWQQIAVVVIAIMIWLTDSQVRKTWFIGVIASGIAMYSLPFSLSLLYRYIEDRTKFWYLCFLIAGSLASLIHPLSFLFFYVPVGLYILYRFRHFGVRFLGTLALFCGIVLIVNLFWIIPFMQHLDLKTSSGYHWIGNLSAFRRDLLGYSDSGLRFLIYLLGIGGLLLWWQNGRKELVRLFLFPVLILTLSGYVSGEITFFKDLETYRNNLVISFLLIIPASAFIVYGISFLRKISHPQRLILAGLILLMCLHLTGRNLAYLTPYFRGNFGHYTLHPLRNEEMMVVRWFQAHTNHDQRIMVEYWPLGALLPWYTGSQVIGGPYPLVWMPHNFVNFANMSDVSVEGGVRLFGHDIADISPRELESYLSAYNVGWIVGYTTESKKLFDISSNIVPVTDFGRYRIYRSTHPASLFLRGNGQVKATYGSLHIVEASDGELILKYHWSPSLVTDPPQKLLPHTILDDPVPFIRVPNNRFRDFVIREG